MCEKCKNVLFQLFEHYVPSRVKIVTLTKFDLEYRIENGDDEDNENI